MVTDYQKYILKPRWRPNNCFTTTCRNEFGEITKNKGHYAVHRSFKVTDFCTNRKLICDFLLVINTNLPPILHLFRDIAFDRSKIARPIFG